MEHTREPWKYGKELSASAGEWLISVDAGSCWRGNPIAETRPATGDEQANARRIVACVNACAGVATEELEQGGFVAGLLERLAEAPRWRDVADEPPQKAQEVLFVHDGKTVHGAWIGGAFWHNNQRCSATAWLPLPMPPKPLP